MRTLKLNPCQRIQARQEKKLKGAKFSLSQMTQDRMADLPGDLMVYNHFLPLTCNYSSNTRRLKNYYRGLRTRSHLHHLGMSTIAAEILLNLGRSKPFKEGSNYNLRF